jgi:(E)-4-hydroxy-3-methylbut-2-enyl-diphosphate synthase
MPNKRKIISYNPDLKQLAGELRKNMTLSEVLLWNELKQKQMLGYDFDSQRPIGNYIVDFFCKELSLAIEIDGDTHIYKYDYDEERQKSLEKLGVHFLRFEDIEVKKNMSNVIRVIEDWIDRNKPTPGLPTIGRDRLSKEGILSNKYPLKINNPTPDLPSFGQERLSRERNLSKKHLVKTNKPTPDPSREGNYTPYISTPVNIGSIPLGGTYPVRIQSMTSTNTLDTSATVTQCIRIIEAGADYIRLTVQGTREAENLSNIKNELRKAGFSTPLVADIHFNPSVAESAARLVEKIRINPGNYADKRATFTKTELTEKEYNDELERIHKRLLPLINICRQNKTVIRIGINHGSLSDRIMTRYGNTPEGMVQSAIEFIKIFRSENFNDLVLSMKSSDTRVVVESNRLLVKMMQEEGVAYPIHLGVTEAGEGEEGRIRSAAGIGALLSEGIGDTIRVSLSEDPEFEIPVAKEILEFLSGSKGRVSVPVPSQSFKTRDVHYKPEVISYKDGQYLTENGKPFQGKMLIFSYKTPPLLSEKSQKKTFLNPIFAENNPVKLAIDAAALLGRYFILKQPEGICITNGGSVHGKILKDLAFSILQATEARITRNRYISCPTCGRTKFNLQETVKKVKAATGHLKGLKIAVMGCIVNGPGEMAGADYGYVGTADGRVHIFRGPEPVLKNISEKDAVNELLKLIEKDLKDN